MEMEIRLQRDYLLGRLNEVFYAKKEAAKNERFFLYDESSPKSFKELQARIAEGRYVLDEKVDEKAYGALHAIKWRDPAKVEDKEGYKSWKIRLLAEANKVKDDLRIKPVEAALESFRSFEALTVN